MIEDGDKVMVCLSGGKDSYTLLDILLNLQQSAPIKLDIVAVNLDQKQPGFPEHVLPEYLESIGVDYKIVQENTYGIVKEKIPEGKTTCSLCSRLRRGIFISYCHRTWCNQNRFRAPPRRHVSDTIFKYVLWRQNEINATKLISDDGKQIVIRPLAYCKEKTLKNMLSRKEFPIIPCNLCGSQPNLQRQVVKEMLNTWDRQYPGRLETMFSAMQNITLSHMCDPKLFDFKGIKHGQMINGIEGDTAFDEEQITPMQFEGRKIKTDFSNNEMINFKEVN